MTEPQTEPQISDEAVDAACRRYEYERTQGLCDRWPSPCDGCDCFRDGGNTMAPALERRQMRAALAAAVPRLHQQWEREHQLCNDGCVPGPAYREACDVLNAVQAVVGHARRISPSPSMTVYVADIERALGMDAPVPHKLGGNEGSGHG